jgi:hypothetical protein
VSAADRWFIRQKYVRSLTTLFGRTDKAPARKTVREFMRMIVKKRLAVSAGRAERMS